MVTAGTLVDLVDSLGPSIIVWYMFAIGKPTKKEITPHNILDVTSRSLIKTPQSIIQKMICKPLYT